MVLWVSLSIAALVYTLLDVSKAEAQLPDLVPWWAYATYGIETLCPIAFGLLAVLLPPRTVDVVAGGYAVLFLVTMATWRLAMTTSHDPGAASPWTNDIITVAVVAVAVIAPPRWAWTYAITATLLVGLVRYLADPELGVVLALMDLLYASLTNAVFTSLTILARKGAARLDRTATLAAVQAGDEAAASARLQERARIDALAHDHVLSTLLVASRADAATRQRLREIAEGVLGVLDEAATDSAAAVSAGEFVAMLRAAVTAQSDGIDFRSGGSSTRTVPMEVTRALLEATSEALRNSLRHAGGADGRVVRSVAVVLTDRSVEVVVEDDGVGFVPRRVPVQRLGVRVSIVGRMGALPGGSARVDSAVGSGTRVFLGWRSG